MVAIRSRSVGHRRPGSLETNGRQSRDDNVGREQSSANLATLVRSGGNGTKPAMLKKADATVYPGWRHDGELKSVEPVKTVVRMVVCSRGRGGEPEKPAMAPALAPQSWVGIVVTSDESGGPAVVMTGSGRRNCTSAVP